MHIDDDDLNAVLSRAFPQGYAVLRHEDGTELLRHSARSSSKDQRNELRALTDRRG